MFCKPMNRYSILCAFMGLLLIGCQDPKEVSNADSSNETLPSQPLMANYPDLQVFMSKPGVRTGSIGVSFPITENKSHWNRLSLGIDGRSYDTRIEFIEKLPTGDKYQIIIYEPRFESEKFDREDKVIYNEVLILTAKRKNLIELEGVQFYTEV